MDFTTQKSNKEVINIGENQSIAAAMMSELREKSFQQQRFLFRNHIKQLGRIAGYEISKRLSYETIPVSTPLANTYGISLQEQPVLAPILRAGLPLYNGLLSIFPNADSAFISAYRKHDSSGKFSIETTSISCPPISNRTLIICDPMLATGKSLIETINQLIAIGTPKKIIISTIICSKEGINHFHKQYPSIPIYTFAVDSELNAKSYIVPGLGDAGDLAFGEKIQQ